jgi:prephenate dehydrogenase
MLAESFTADLREAGWRVTLVHRDIDKGQNERASDYNSA